MCIEYVHFNVAAVCGYLRECFGDLSGERTE